MVNILGNKVAQKIAGKHFLAKGFFVITDVYFQNMVIRNCDYARQAAIKPQKVIVRLSVFPENSLNKRLYTLLGNTRHLIGRSIALLGDYILIKIYIA